jgi:hypothetical protein
LTLATGQAENKCSTVSTSLQNEQIGLSGHFLRFKLSLVGMACLKVRHMKICILEGSLAGGAKPMSDVLNA